MHFIDEMNYAFGACKLIFLLNNPQHEPTDIFFVLQIEGEVSVLAEILDASLELRTDFFFFLIEYY